MIPVQTWDRKLSLNFFRRLAPGADRGSRETALELVSSPAAMSTARLNMTPTWIQHGFVAFFSTFPGPPCPRKHSEISSRKSIVDC
jgi:hypothetical protein